MWYLNLSSKESDHYLDLATFNVLTSPEWRGKVRWHISKAEANFWKGLQKSGEDPFLLVIFNAKNSILSLFSPSFILRLARSRFQYTYYIIITIKNWLTKIVGNNNSWKNFFPLALRSCIYPVDRSWQGFYNAGTLFPSEWLNVLC